MLNLDFTYKQPTAEELSAAGKNKAKANVIGLVLKEQNDAATIGDFTKVTGSGVVSNIVFEGVVKDRNAAVASMIGDGYTLVSNHSTVVAVILTIIRVLKSVLAVFTGQDVLNRVRISGVEYVIISKADKDGKLLFEGSVVLQRKIVKQSDAKDVIKAAADEAKK